MSKKFKFKLDGLLKLKNFNESRCRAELGQIVKEIEDVKANIERINEEVHQGYHEQGRILEDATSGQLLQFFPLYIQGKKEDIKNQENLLYALQKRYERKLQELSELMGEAKLINNMKENKKLEHKKQQDKKREEEQEELFQSRRKFLKDLG